MKTTAVVNFLPLAQLVEAQSMKLVVVASVNPKRKGTRAHKIFAAMMEISARGGTLADFLLRGVGDRGNIRYEIQHGFAVLA